MKKVTGIGGIFFKAQNPQALYNWYEQHLGIQGTPLAGALFPWKEAEAPHQDGTTVWSIFPKDTDYLGSSQTSFMMNYRVANLKELLHSLSAQGIEILGQQDSEYGQFAWIQDIEGNRIELWEPPSSTSSNPNASITLE